MLRFALLLKKLLNLSAKRGYWASARVDQAGYKYSQRHGQTITDVRLAAAGLIVAVIAGANMTQCQESQPPQEVSGSSQNPRLGQPVAGIKTIRLGDVRTHVSRETGGIWVVYKHGVYDITDFVESHPGGKDKIMMAAGGSVEPFWKVFAIHQSSKNVGGLLEQMRIGNLHPDEVAAAAKPPPKPKAPDEDGDPFAQEPERPLAGLGLVVNSDKPFNAETTPSLLTTAFYTPNDLHYKRNHLAVPRVPVSEVDSGRYLLEVSGLGLGGKRIAYTVSDLRTRFPQVTVPVTLQCAGNRRQQMSEARSVRGLSWRDGAIGTATWTGVRLRDLLKDAGVDPEHVTYGITEELRAIQHVQMEGADCDIGGKCYGASVPAHRALAAGADVIVAHSMNGEALPADHGYPLRLVAPGVVGARQVKWLKRIVLAAEESPSHWQQHDYKSFSPSADPAKLPYDTAVSIQDLPVQSQVCEPAEGAVLSLGEVESDGVPVRGYAYSGGGRRIVRVDVSADDGETWVSADLEDKPKIAADQAKRGRDWTWTLWNAEVPVPKKVLSAARAAKVGEKVSGTGVEIVCRAVDDQYQVQPESCMHIWNPRGLLNTSWGRRNITVAREDDYEEPVELETLAGAVPAEQIVDLVARGAPHAAAAAAAGRT